MNRHTDQGLLQDIACPFCGLCCDDLSVSTDGARLKLVDTRCTQAAEGFDAGTEETDTPRIAGRPCGFDEAVALAAALLDGARQPLFGGLGTDVAGARALLQLADRCGAGFDHMNSAAMLRNLLVVQDSGWMTTTLTEVRNRADVMLAFGTGIPRHAPRFYERVFNAATSMFDTRPPQRELIVIGESPQPPPVDPAIRTTLIDCQTARLGEVAMALRALQSGARLQTEAVAGIAVERLQAVLEQLQAAHYGVVAWVAAELAFAHAELAVQAFCELATSLNDTTRCSALPLGGSNADHTFAQVATWQTGYPTRASLADGRPDFDPFRYDGIRMLADAEADLLLWVSAFDRRRTPPPCNVPAIVLGRAGMRPETPPAVFIPVATPGLDSAGHVYRCDGVATLPLRSLRQSALPGVGDTVQAILAGIAPLRDAPC